MGYLQKARTEDMDLFLSFGTPPRSDAFLSNQFAYKHMALKKEMTDLAIKYPELASR